MASSLNISTQGTIDDDVIAAIYSGTTQVVRRIEIYEANGTTRWRPDINPRLIAGTVSISTGGNIRRNLDVTLNNDDGEIDHDPDGGLWYDKIIKVFRGVEYPNRKTKPTVGLLGFTIATANSMAKYLQRIGITKFVNLTADANFTMPSTVDILVAWKNGSDFDATTASIIASVYSAGGNVLTVNNFATPTSVPLISTTVTRVGTTQWTINPVSYDTPFNEYMTVFKMNAANGETIPNAVRASARAFATDTYSAATVYPLIYETNGNGGRWVHIHPTVIDTITPASNYSRFMTMLPAIVDYLYSFADSRLWETQVGEFMIDKISEPRFPSQIQITGRDYGKKLDRFKIRNNTTFTAGTKLDSALAGIAAQAGIKKMKINSGGAALTQTIPFDRTASGLDMFDQITASENCEYFMDRYGYLVVRPFLDPSSSPVSVSLQTQDSDTQGNLVDFTKTSDDSEMYNIIVVTGQDADGNAVHSGVAVNGVFDSKIPGLPPIQSNVSYSNKSSSPTSIQKIGQVHYFYTSALFTTDAQCLAYAKKLLAVKGLESYSIDFSSLVFPWIEVGEIVEAPPFATEDYPTRYLLTDISLPLGLEPMTGTCQRITEVT